MTKQDYINQFPDYVMSFYGPGGIYDYGFTLEEIANAIKVRQTSPNLNNIPFDGDSYDRELVRDIVLKHRNSDAITEHTV